jgi:integrase
VALSLRRNGSVLTGLVDLFMPDLWLFLTGLYTISKGKAISGEFPIEVICNIKSSMLNSNSPFMGFSTHALKLRIYRATTRLKDKGLIRDAYSAHDFRHYFAVSQYKEDRDIFKLSKLLDHSNISITQTYLKSLEIDV